MKNKINDGHYLELMDRIHIIMLNIQDHLIDHPLAENEMDVQKKIKKAQNNLWKAYQLVGNKEDSYEKNKPIAKVISGRHKKS
jgi:hypothetical protein